MFEETLETKISHAVYHNDISTLEQYFGSYDINMICADYNGSLIFYAVSQNKTEIVCWLIEHGADMYFRNSFGDMALHLAARLGHIDIIKVFGSHGMDLDVIGQEDGTALNWAALYRHDDMAIYLINQGASLDIIPDDFVFGVSPRDRIYSDKIDKLICKRR